MAPAVAFLVFLSSFHQIVLISLTGPQSIVLSFGEVIPALIPFFGWGHLESSNEKEIPSNVSIVAQPRFRARLDRSSVVDAFYRTLFNSSCLKHFELLVTYKMKES